MHALTAPLSELAEIEEICEERGREPGMLLLSGLSLIHISEPTRRS